MYASVLVPTSLPYSMATDTTTATQTAPAQDDNVSGEAMKRCAVLRLTCLQVIYFHSGSKLSYRKVQKNAGAKGSFTSIPVVDISKIDSTLLDDRKVIASELYDACSTSGFFYISSHGVSVLDVGPN